MSSRSVKLRTGYANRNVCGVNAIPQQPVLRSNLLVALTVVIVSCGLTWGGVHGLLSASCTTPRCEARCVARRPQMSLTFFLR